jgi:hypothetical protein
LEPFGFGQAAKVCPRPWKVAHFGLGGRHVADLFEQAAGVEPVNLCEGGELDRPEVVPGAAPMDDLGLEQAVDRVGPRLVVLSPTLLADGSTPAFASRSA